MKQEKKKKTLGDVIVFCANLIFFGMIAVGVPRAAWAFVILVVAVSGVLVGKSRVKSRGAAKAPRQGGPEAGKIELGKVLSKLTGADKDPIECEYGEGNHRYSHDEERRLQQLEGFLKNGIIDRDEYQVLLRRYKDAGQ